MGEQLVEAGSIPVGVTRIFHWHNPTGYTISLGLTQPLTERTGNLTTIMCQVFWKWESQPPAQGLLFLYLDKKLWTIIHKCIGSYFNYILTNESLHKSLLFCKSTHFLHYATLRFTAVFIWAHCQTLPWVALLSFSIPSSFWFTLILFTKMKSHT